MQAMTTQLIINMKGDVWGGYVKGSSVKCQKLKTHTPKEKVCSLHLDAVFAYILKV